MASDLGTTLLDETFETTDAAVAETLLERVSAGARIHESDSPFVFRQRTVGDERLQLTTFETTAFLHMAVEISGAVGVGVRRRGDLRVLSNGREVEAAAPFVLAPGIAESWSTGLDAQMVGLHLPSLEAFVGRDVARGMFRTDGFPAVSAAMQRNWQVTTAHLEGVLGDPELLHNDLIRQAVVDAAYATALSTFELGWDDAPAVAEPSAIRRAQAFIDDNLAAPISVADVAEAARMSVRGLQSMFARTLGVTPARYIRGVRLEAAHEALRLSSPDDTTVAAVARAWGFTHLPRFAQHYRARYGLPPSETLRG